MLNSILCQWTAGEIIAVVVVVLIICSFPAMFYLFGAEYEKEDGSCGNETRWQRLMKKWFGKKSE